VAVAERVYVTCYGFATKAGIACGRIQDITAPPLPNSLFSTFSPGHDGDDCDDDQNSDGCLPAPIAIAADLRKPPNTFP
jgi:hypothetical protein